MAMFIALLSFFLITAVVLSGFYFATADTPIEQRLRTLGPAPATLRPAAQEPALLSRALRRLLTRIGQFGFGGDVKNLSGMLAVAGMRSPNAVFYFVGVRTLLSFGPALLLLIRQITAGTPTPIAVAQAALAWMIGHALCNFVMRQRAKARAHAIEINLPDALDLMVVCLEAGLGLNATIGRVGEERAAMSDPLGVEFGIVARELREGRAREDALRGLAERNGVDDLKSLTALIIQSDRLGASMAKTLRSHADVLRTKRRQRAEEHARRLPIKMLFPLGFFLLPALIVIVIGPAWIKLAAFFGDVANR